MPKISISAFINLQKSLICNHFLYKKPISSSYSCRMRISYAECCYLIKYLDDDQIKKEGEREGRNFSMKYFAIFFQSTSTCFSNIFFVICRKNQHENIKGIHPIHPCPTNMRAHNTHTHTRRTQTYR